MTEYPHPPIQENGIDQCVQCGETLPPTRTGPVVNADTGTQADSVLDAARDAPLTCPSCYDEMQEDAVREEQEKHRTLSQFA